MENVLQKIINKKKERIKICKSNYSESTILENIKTINNFVNFKDEIKKKNLSHKISIIPEIKKASPSAGEILKDFNPVDIAKIYIDNGASFLSVLTEEDFFWGKLNHIKNIKQNYKIPILCKDFFIDTYQVPLAKSFGADCILIILSAVDKMLAKDLYQTAMDLNISTLVEVHSKNEAEIALSFEDALIGINNRNLKTLQTSSSTSVELSKILSSHKNPLISESGLSSPESIKFIIKNAKIHTFLIGESFLRSSNIGDKFREFSQISL